MRTSPVALAVLLSALPAAAAELQVSASEAIAPCLGPALDAYTRESRVPVSLQVGAPDAAGQASLVVGDDSELRRALEGGAADVRTAIDLGYVPWVSVSPLDPVAASSGARELTVLGGPAGERARESAGARALDVTRDIRALRSAAYALVPRTLAGPGRLQPADVPALVAVAAVVNGSRAEADARRLLAYLGTPRAQSLLGRCFAPPPAFAAAPAAAPYAVAVADYWLPDCSVQRNRHNDPGEVVGSPDAANLGGGMYRGMMSLGQGGWVTVDMGATVVDGPGDDVRVYQTTSSEEVTVYASSSPQGPFTLLGLREPCGIRTAGMLSGHCDFDLRSGGLSDARYLRVEDGEIYPCLSGGTISEGADIDAVQALNFR
ncbi:MAG: hypothetical protein ABW221_18350 [Vicinamibacteria bacterium]